MRLDRTVWRAGIVCFAAVLMNLGSSTSTLAARQGAVTNHTAETLDEGQNE